MSAAGDVRGPVPGAPHLVLGDDWPDAWEGLRFTRPGDWRDVADELAWDVAAVCAAWVHLEAFHQDRRRVTSLREQDATVLPLVEEGLALHLDDAALGAALHVAVEEAGTPVGLCLVSHDGRPRSVVPTTGTATSTLRTLVAAVARA